MWATFFSSDVTDVKKITASPVFQMEANDTALPTMEEIDNKFHELQNSKNYNYQDDDVDQVSDALLQFYFSFPEPLSSHLKITHEISYV